MMKRHFHDDLKVLKQELLKMGLLVEEAIQKSTEALIERNLTQANEVFANEDKVNRLEIEIDEKGHSLLAMEQPVAVDMRLLTMILKINTTLERIGDHAVNIAQRAERIIQDASGKIEAPVREMAGAAKEMLKNALDSFVNEDVALAESVLKSDDQVDQYDHQVYLSAKEYMMDHPSTVEYGINLMMVAYNLERTADLACNIAEDVIYIKQGREVRHLNEDKP
jgi:phosphate transport system protein